MFTVKSLPGLFYEYVYVHMKCFHRLGNKVYSIDKKQAFPKQVKIKTKFIKSNFISPSTILTLQKLPDFQSKYAASKTTTTIIIILKIL